ncbi:MAG: hypothetical protein KA116_01560 [Proteobacteria bacterium]|nr:hypothetical protein [Pseudomonadota bacterium]
MFNISQEKSLFRKNLETLLLSFPLLLLLGVAIEVILGPFWPQGMTHYHRWVRFLVNVVCLNGIHIIFTFVMIGQLPELQNWARKKSPHIWTYIWLGVGTLASIIAFSGSYFKVESPLRSLGAQLLFIAAIILPSYHNVWQIRGLALSYRQKETHSAEARHKIIFYDKLFYYALFASYCLLLLSMFGWTLPWSQNFHPLWTQLSESGWLFKIKQIATLLCAFCAAGLLWRALRNPQKNKSNLTLYLLRLLLFPLSAYSYIALMGVLASHGIEYFVVFKQMIHNSKASQQNKKELYQLTLSASFFVFVCSIPGIFLANTTQPALWIILLSALGTGINFTHYYLDRILFKMRDPITREHTGPLLTAKN